MEYKHVIYNLYLYLQYRKQRKYRMLYRNYKYGTGIEEVQIPYAQC